MSCISATATPFPNPISANPIPFPNGHKSTCHDATTSYPLQVNHELVDKVPNINFLEIHSSDSPPSTSATRSTPTTDPPSTPASRSTPNLHPRPPPPENTYSRNFFNFNFKKSLAGAQAQPRQESTIIRIQSSCCFRKKLIFGVLFATLRAVGTPSPQTTEP